MIRPDLRIRTSPTAFWPMLFLSRERTFIDRRMPIDLAAYIDQET